MLALALAACSDDGGTAGDNTEETSVDDTDAPSDDTTVATSAETAETVTEGSNAPGDTSAPEGTVAEGDEAACEALRPISEHDAAFGPLLEGGDWEEIRSFLVDREAEIGRRLRGDRRAGARHRR